MIAFLFTNWKWLLIGALLFVVGFLLIQVSNKETTIQKKIAIIEKKNTEIIDREAKIARVNEEISKLKESQKQDASSIEALKNLAQAKDKQMSIMRVNFHKELDVCYNSKEIPVTDAKTQGVLDDATNRAYVRLLNGILAPGVPENPGTTHD